MKNLLFLFFMLVFFNILLSLKGVSQNIIEIDNCVYDYKEDKSSIMKHWNGEDWILLGSLMQQSDKSYIKYKNNIYEAGSYVTNEEGTVSYFRKTNNTLEEASNENSNIKSYPNPSFNTSTIYINCFPENTEVIFVLYNYMGREVKRIENIKNPKMYFSKGDLSEGIYLFKFYYQEGLLGSGKIILN